mmetsp:Transcript_2507/g.7050  ORF Transcript_2507/g.7050 Transcript_2507/m.7050 type:complete len:218 (-) Transcript_2507:151-804(-)
MQRTAALAAPGQAGQRPSAASLHDRHGHGELHLLRGCEVLQVPLALDALERPQAVHVLLHGLPHLQRLGARGRRRRLHNGRLSPLRGCHVDDLRPFLVFFARALGLGRDLGRLVGGTLPEPDLLPLDGGVLARRPLPHGRGGARRRGLRAWQLLRARQLLRAGLLLRVLLLAVVVLTGIRLRGRRLLAPRLRAGGTPWAAPPAGAGVVSHVLLVLLR